MALMEHLQKAIRVLDSVISWFMINSEPLTSPLLKLVEGKCYLYHFGSN